MFVLRHYQQKLQELKNQYEDCAEKIAFLQKKESCEAGASVQFQLKKELEDAEKQRDLIIKEITKYESLDSIERLHAAFLRLDFEKQVRLFKDFIEIIKAQKRIGAFVLQGESPEYGQIWLLKRLLRQVSGVDVNTSIKRFYPRKSQKNNISNLWRELGKEVGGGLKYSSQNISQDEIKQIIEKTIQVLKTEHLILVLHNVEELNEEHLNDFICSFWSPLAEAICMSNKSINNLLLLFLVDNEGCVSSWNITFAQEFDSNWQPHIPIILPMIKSLSDDILTNWFNYELDSLPHQITREISYQVQMILEQSAGIPELVFNSICDLCECDNQEWRNKWEKL